MKKFKALVLVLALALMSSSLGSCATKVEAADFTGMLTVVNDEKVVVSNAKGAKEFLTDENTVYDMGTEGHFSMNDIVHVKYHSKGRKMVADEIDIRKHVHKDLSFSGTITGLDDNTLTVTGKSLTVTFAIDGNTSVDGKLAKGNEVKVVYLGDLSEFPRADRIVVTKEHEQAPEKLTVSGILSEKTDSSVQVSIDSAHSRKFAINKDTKITGVAKELKTGDSVNVTFNNTEDAAPLAFEINIVKEATPEIRTLNGTVKSYDKKTLVITTAKKSYKFGIDKNTKFKGVSPEPGYTAEVTYAGEWVDKPVATIVYCKKNDDPQPTPPAPTPTPTPPVPPTPPTPEQPIDAQGTLTAWGIDGQDKCTVKVDGSGEITLAYSGDSLEIQPGYFPQSEDYVHIVYTASDMKLSRIDLITRPEMPVETEATLLEWGIDGQNKCKVAIEGKQDIVLSYVPEDLIMPVGYRPQENDKVKILYTQGGRVLSRMEPIVTPEDQKQEEPEKKEEPVPAPEPAPAPEQKEEPAPAPEPEQSAEPEQKEEASAPVAVDATGTIISSDVEKRTCKMDIGGETVELTFDDETQCASGYFPQEGDQVKVLYIKDGNLIKNIQLVGRPQPAEGDAQ